MDPLYNEGRRIVTYLGEVYPELFTAANFAVAFSKVTYAECWKLFLKEMKVIDYFRKIENYQEIYQSGEYSEIVATFLSASFDMIDDIYAGSEDLMFYEKLINDSLSKTNKILLSSLQEKINAHIKKFNVSGTQELAKYFI